MLDLVLNDGENAGLAILARGLRECLCVSYIY